MLSDILLFGALILIGLKYGLVARLRELGRVLDRLVNVLLVVIAVMYGVQLAYVLIAGRH